MPPEGAEHQIDRASARPEGNRLLSPAFVLLLAAGAANFLAMGSIMPLLPRFAKDSLGGSDFMVGVVVGVFAVSAIAVRPAAAIKANTRGRRPVMVAGALMTAVSFLLYAAAPSFAVLVPARLLTGAGQALFFTAAATMVTELAPDHRRAEAVSYFSVAVYLGNGLGPAIGELVRSRVWIGWGFVVASAFGFAAAAISLRLHETNQPREEAAVAERMQIHRAALLPGVVLALGMVSNVAFNAYMPLYSDELGMNGSQFVFMAFTGVVLSIRLFGARWPDQLGPARAGTIATVVIACGMTTIAALDSPAGLYLGAIVFAFGISFHYPSLMALVVNRTSPKERSAVVATFTAFFDIASGVGGVTVGAVVGSSGYRGAYTTAAITALLGLVVLQFALRGGSWKTSASTAA